MARNGEEFGYAYKALANPYPNKHMDPFILSYPSKDAFKYSFQHDNDTDSGPCINTDFMK